MLHYNRARCVWALQDPDLVEAINGVTEPDVDRWIFAVMDELPHDNFVQVIVTLWAIWYVRQQALHEQIFQSPHATHNFVMQYIKELEECKSKKSPIMVSTATRQPRTRWILPVHGVAKLRVDAVISRELNEGSYSAICRDSSGIFLGASAIRCTGITDPGTLEALACREALALTQDLSLS